MLWKALLFTTFVVGVFCNKTQLEDKYKQRIHQYVEATCTKHNAKDKAPQMEQSIYSFVDCIYEHEDPSILRDLNNLEDQQSVITVYKRVCKKVPDFKTCLYKLMDETAVCGKKQVAEEITEAKKFLDDLLEYLCGNDAKKFVDFVNDESLQCIDQKSSALKTCIDKAYSEFGSGEESSSESESNSAELKEACSTFDDMSKCIHNALVDCPKPTTSEFLDGMFALIRKASRCSKLN